MAQRPTFRLSAEGRFGGQVRSALTEFVERSWIPCPYFNVAGRSGSSFLLLACDRISRSESRKIDIRDLDAVEVLFQQVPSFTVVAALEPQPAVVELASRGWFWAPPSFSHILSESLTRGPLLSCVVKNLKCHVDRLKRQAVADEPAVVADKF